MALQLAEVMKAHEVNEETIKTSKKILAAVNKRCKELDGERIRIKKLMLEPYQEFEDQVKEIVGIVKEADETVRLQVKDLEEAERLKKEVEIWDIWDKRIHQYELGDLIPFTDFIKPKHLNKSTSIEAAEKDMVDFLEQTERDIKVLQKLPDLSAHVSAYIGTYDLAQAMNHVMQENERRRQIEAAQGQKKSAQYVQAFKFTVFGEKDKTLLEMFMKQNKINYELENKC
jgi:L-lysine 2,3-aminomutase